MPFYLTPKQDDYNQIPELQDCNAEALYDAEAVLSNPGAFKAEEIRTLRDQIVSNLESPSNFPQETAPPYEPSRSTDPCLFTRRVNAYPFSFRDRFHRASASCST